MVKIPSAEEISSRYKGAIPRVAEAYRKGVNATSDWQQSALEGQGRYEARMQDREVLARRAKKISNVSNEEWKSKATNLGTSRIGAGMEQAIDKQKRGFAPFREKLAGLTLPEKTTDPMTNLTQRAGAVVKAMVETKKEQS